MPDENVKHYEDAPINVLRAVLNSGAISLSSKTRSALEILLAKKLENSEVIKEASRPEMALQSENFVLNYNSDRVIENKSVNAKVEKRIAVKPKKTKVEEILDDEIEEDFFENIRYPDFENFEPFVFEKGGERFYLIKDLYKKFPLIHAKSDEEINGDFNGEEDVLFHENAVYARETLYERIKNSITDHTAANRLKVYPSAIDVLIKERRIEPVTSRVHYLVLRDSIEKLGTLSYKEIENLNSKAIEHALAGLSSEGIVSEI